MNEAGAGAAACQGSELAAQGHCVATSICHCVQHQSITGTDNLREQQTQKLQLRKCVAQFAALVFFPPPNLYVRHATASEYTEAREADEMRLLHQSTMDQDESACSAPPR